MINDQKVPAHIAIIMDGNRRWARVHNLPVLEGHRRVADNILEPLVEHAARRGVSYITFWAWSTENWQRDKQEVSGIMKIFKHVIAKRWSRLHKKGVRIKVIGDISGFESGIKHALEKVVEQTKDNTKITAIFALNYGGRDEILRAIGKVIGDKRYVISKTEKNLRLTSHARLAARQVSRFTEHDFSQFLDTAGIPDPDFIIRTGGEQRLSGFLLWQSEYSELYFPSWYMPEFTPEKLDECLEEYVSRQRRFGK